MSSIQPVIVDATIKAIYQPTHEQLISFVTISFRLTAAIGSAQRGTNLVYGYKFRPALNHI